MSRICYSLSKKMFVTNGSCRLNKAVEERLDKATSTYLNHMKNRSFFWRNVSREYVQKQVRYTHCGTVDSNKLPTVLDDDSFDSTSAAKSFCFTTAEETQAYSDALRNQLYEGSKDPLTNRLKECFSEEEVFRLLEQEYSVLNAEHVSQAVLVLRDIEASSGISISEKLYRSNVNLRTKYSKASNGASNFQTNLAAENTHFVNLLAKINELRDQLSLDALASTALYLQRLGTPLSNPTQSSLLMELEKRIESLDCYQLPVSTLSKYSTVIRIHYQRWSSLYLVRLAESKAKELIDLCANFSDLKHICIFYHNCAPLITDSIMANIKAKVTTLLENIDSVEPSDMIRIMSFLNQTQWREKNHDLLLQLLKWSTDKDVQFSLRQLLDLPEIFPGNSEPHSLLVLLNKHNSVLERLENGENKVAVYFLRSIASNYSIKCQHDLQRELTQCLSGSASGQESMFFLTVLYSMFQHLKTLNRKVHLSYWSRVLNHLELEPAQERSISRLTSLFSRYLMFNSRYLNVRHYNFELKMAAWLVQDLKTGLEKYYPTWFARAVAFLLAYGQFRNLDYLDALIKKLLSVIHQLDVTDWFTVSAGLFTAMELRRKQSLSPEFLQQFVQLSSSLNKAALDYLKANPSISTRHLGYLAQSYHYRHGVVDSDLFLEIITRYRSLSVENITPRAVTDAIKYLFRMDYFVPELLETMAECVIKYNKDLKGNVAETVLQVCFHFGYTPHCAQEFFPVVHELLNRDKRNIKCLHLIRAAISLAYFYQLPQSLIQSIFNIEFLDMVDEEIKLSSVKVTYPMKARNLLMELNRTVCLDYPEQDIPWFHARYCEEISAVESLRTTSFHEDVHDVLVHLLGDKKLFSQNVTSPYFYKIDFEIFLDQKEVPVEAKLVKNRATHSRVAVLLLQKKDISVPSEQLKGFAQLRQRHLELMGYQVVSISPILWNTMFMTEKCCKADFLRQKIWPKYKKS